VIVWIILIGLESVSRRSIIDITYAIFQTKQNDLEYVLLVC